MAKLVLTLLIFLLLGAALQAQLYFDAPPRPCLPRSTWVETLERLGEALYGAGIRESGGVAELWVKDTIDDPSWTIIVSFPNDNSCMIESGSAWTIEGYKHSHGGPPL